MSAESVRLPTFLILGAAKAGTTALYDYLRQHPDVYLSPLKETNFFAFAGQVVDFHGPGDAETINALSITDEAGYAAQFAGVTDEQAIGEASPLYLYHPAVPRRVRDRLPHARLLVLLRHPVDRAYSAFLHTRRDGREPVDDFRQALALEDQRVATGWEHLWHYRRMGFYGEQLRRWYDAFPAKQIAVFLHEDFCANAAGLLSSIYRFLGVDDGFVTDTRTRPNASARPDTPPLPPSLRKELSQLYREDIALTERLLGRDLGHWLV